MADDVKLSSLRVSAQLDASAYKAGADQKVAADRAMVASGQQVNVAVSQTDVKISQAGDVIARLSRQYVDGYAAAQRMSSAVNLLSSQIERGNTTAAQAAPILDGIARKYGEIGNAELFAARGQREFAEAITAANSRLAQQQALSAQTMAAANQNQGGLARFGAINAAAQFQDIAVTAAMGQNIMTIALQQGTQLGPALENVIVKGTGAMGVVRGLGDVVKTLITPTNLIGIAFTAAAAAAIQFGTYLLNRSGDLKQVLEDHKKLIDEIAAAYPKAGEAAKKYQDEASKLGQSVLIADAAKQRKTEADALALSVRDIIAQLQTGAGWGVWGTAAATAFAGLGEELKNNQLTARQLADRLGEIRLDPNASAGARRFATELQEAVNQAADLEAHIKAIDAAMNALRDERPAMRQVQRELGTTVGRRAGDLRTFEEQDAARRQLDLARTDAERLAAIERQIRADRRKDADAEGGLEARVQRALLEERAKQVNEEKELQRQRAVSRSQAEESARSELEMAGRTTIAQEAARDALQQKQELYRLAAEKGRAVSEAEIAAIEATAAAMAKLNALTEQRQAIADRDVARTRTLEDMRTELALIGQVGARQDALRQQYEQIATIKDEAAKAGTDQTAEGLAAMNAEIARVQSLTGEYEKLADAINRRNLQDELGFELRQVGRSEQDQRIGARLRGAGLDDRALDSSEANTMRQIEQIERIKDTWGELFDTVNDGVDTMVDALFEGTDDWEETLKKMGRDFARQMFDLALTNPLKNWLTGGNLNTVADLVAPGTPGFSSGRGGGFGGVLGNLFGANKAVGGAISQAVATMQVQAATVIVNGGIVPGASGIPGIPGVPGTGGAGTGGVSQATIQSRIDQAFGTGGTSQNAIQSRIDQVFGTTSALKAAGTTSQGINLSQITAGNLTARVSSEYAGRFQGLLTDLEKAGYPVSSLGEGGYSRVRMTQGGVGTGGSLSRHSFGEALDINPRRNPFRAGARGDFGEYGVDPSALARKHGLQWGGDWRTPDTMHFQVDKSAQAIDSMTTSATKAAESLSQTGIAGLSAVKGLTDAAGGLTQFGSIVSKFMAPGGGSGAGWFQNLSGMFGGAGGAISYMQGISPAATSNILAGIAGPYHEGGIAGYPSSYRHVDPRIFIGARRYHNGGMAGDEVPAILRKGEPVFRSMEDARRMFAPANRNDAAKVNVNLKNINLFDPSVVGDYVRTDPGEQAMINMMRRTGQGRGL